MKRISHLTPLFLSAMLAILLVGIPFSSAFSQRKKDRKKKKQEQTSTTHGSCCDPQTGGSSTGGDKTLKMGEVTISEVALQNQDGETVNFQDLVRDKIVAINFVFTTCKTICPPMGANFAELNRRMAETRGEELAMISVSIDPTNDTPERMKAWSEKFSPEPGWTLLTGEKQSVDQLLKELKVFTPLKEDHAPILMMGKVGEDNWIRTNGLGNVDLLETTLKGYFESESPEVSSVVDDETTDSQAVSSELTPGQKQDLNWFTDTPLIDQNGEEFHLYSDLMKDKVVFINPFFAECTGSCPVMHKMMQEVQLWLGDRLGEEVVMISMTVDPENDTPEKLAQYAASYEARPGWHFLSGEPENVDKVMKQLGKYVEQRETHDAIILIGNLNTRLWKKANGLAHPMEVIKVLQSVMEDEG